MSANDLSVSLFSYLSFFYSYYPLQDLLKGSGLTVPGISGGSWAMLYISEILPASPLSLPISFILLWCDSFLHSDDIIYHDLSIYTQMCMNSTDFHFYRTIIILVELLFSPWTNFTLLIISRPPPFAIVKFILSRVHSPDILSIILLSFTFLTFFPACSFLCLYVWLRPSISKYLRDLLNSLHTECIYIQNES